MLLARERAQATAAPRASQATRVMIAAGAVLLLAVGTWWGLRGPSGGAGLKAPPPIAATVAVPPITPEPQLGADALGTLQGLRALVQARASYAEYGPRAFEAKKTVDKFANTPGGDADLKRSARATMDLYMLAATAWNAGLVANAGNEAGAASAFASISRDPALELCQAASEARDTVKADPTVSQDVARGMGVVEALPAIFACAESRLAEVERRMAGR